VKRKRVALIIQGHDGGWSWHDADAFDVRGDAQERATVIRQAEELGYEIETEESIAEALEGSDP
jgi:hypothetical protein